MDDNGFDGQSKTTVSPDTMRMFQYQKGAIYVIMPEGADPCFGFPCAHGKGVQCLATRDALPDELKEVNITIDKYNKLVTDVDAKLDGSVFPACPCALTIIGIFVLKFAYIQRLKAITAILDAFNKDLAGRGVEWLYSPCENGEIFVISLHFKDLSKQHERIAANNANGLTKLPAADASALAGRTAMMNRMTGVSPENA